MAAISGFTLTVSSGSDGDTITTGNSTFSAVSGAPKVDTGWHIVNARSARFTPDAASMTGRLQAASPLTTAYMAGPIRLWSRPSANTPIVHVRDNSNAARAQIQWLTDGTMRLRNQNQSAVGVTSAAIPVDGEDGSDGVYWLTLQITASTFRARLYPLGSATPLWDSGSQSYAGGSFQRVSLGVDTAATADISFDSWSADDASMPAQPVTAPEITIVSDDVVSIADGQSTAIDTTITGSYTSATWTFDAGAPSTATGQLSTTSGDDPTFTPAGGPGTYVARRTVTWSDGTVSATVTVVVLPLTAQFPVVAVTASGWTVEGDADDLRDAVTDGDNGTAARSPANPSSSDFLLELGGGLKPAAGQAWTFPLRIAAASGSFVATLKQHDGSTTVHALSSIDIDDGTAVPGETDMYDHVLSFSAANWASMPDGDWTSGPTLLVEVSD